MKVGSRTRLNFAGRLAGTAVLLAGSVLGHPFSAYAAAQTAAPAPEKAGTTAGPGVPFTAEKMSSLLPQTVYFAGRTAPLQLRNASGTKFANGSILWVSLVDSSGYSSSVQERYQFYLVTEGPLRFGDVGLRAGAYGGGFVGDHFVLMDLGDHTVGEGPTQADAAMRRPRPLQLTADHPDAVKLYLGRKWVTLRSVAP